MRTTIVSVTLGLAVLSLAGEARAAGWGLHSGDTLGAGDNMLYGELGWPDVAAGFQHGVSNRLDVGFRFGIGYGFDYTVAEQPGMTMRVPIRFALLKSNRASFLFHFDPGLKFDSLGEQDVRVHGIYNDGGLAFGFTLGIGFEAGFHLTREATLGIGLDVPIYLNLSGGVYSAIPFLFGPGFDYQIDNRFSLGFTSRFGPDVFAKSGADHAELGLITQAYFAYRL